MKTINNTCRKHHSQNILSLTIIFVCTIISFIPAKAQTIPSFPGAEGFGAVTVGGRGGEVYHVTNLNNAGPGSFREALEAEGSRTVVFDVSGIIHLTEEIQLTNPYITIAGQTAPGEGIIIAGATVNMTGRVNDVMVRYMRFRRSYDKDAPFPTPNSANAGQCLVGMSVSKNLMMDHISASWGTDENFSMYRCMVDGNKLIPTKNITIQWCIISEALNPAQHAFANTWGGQGSNQHHNLMACNVGRNPSISFSHFMDYRNNVVFNWRDRSMDGGGKEAHVNVINNYYKPGPATGYNWDWSAPLPELKARILLPEVRTWDNWEELGLDKKTRYSGPGVVGWWYVDGNIMEGHPEISNDNWEGESMVNGRYYTGVQWSNWVKPYPGIGPELTDTFPQWEGDMMADHLEWARANEPHTHVEFPENPRDPYDGENGEIFVLPDLPLIATQNANDAYKTVLTNAGAIYPVRDAVDLRIIASIIDGNPTSGSHKNGIIDHPDEVGGYPVIGEIKRHQGWDTDMDGMPDEWELSKNLDPENKADRNDDYDQDGYTNLEEYLNYIGAFAAVQAIVWDGEVNNRYARIENWNIAFQPSRFDTALIKSYKVIVDAIDQHAGILLLKDTTELLINTGILNVANYLEISSKCKVIVETEGKLIANKIINNGKLTLEGNAGFSCKSLINNDTIDISKWKGTLPSGLLNNGVIIDSIGIITTSLPIVSIAYPNNNTLIALGESISIAADASFEDGSITAVEFYSGQTLLGTDDSSPYSYSINNATSNTYSITAKAISERINTISPLVEFTVTSFPTVEITTPVDEENFYQNSTVTLSANAHDTDGSVYSVEFFQNDSSIGFDYIHPYIIAWDSVKAGNYSIKAKVTDNDGAFVLSESININISDTGTMVMENILNQVKIYPNPTNELISIDLSSIPKKGIAISLYDLSGRQIKSEQCKTAKHTINLHDLPSGIYIIKLSDTHTSITHKVSKL